MSFHTVSRFVIRYFTYLLTQAAYTALAYLLLNDPWLHN